MYIYNIYGTNGYTQLANINIYHIISILSSFTNQVHPRILHGFAEDPLTTWEGIATATLATTAALTATCQWGAALFQGDHLLLRRTRYLDGPWI